MEFKIQLQLFAEGEKTEKATPKKRREAREEGQVFQSKEISSVFILLISFLAFNILGKFILKNLIELMKYLFSSFQNLDDIFTQDNIRIKFLSIIAVFLKVSSPILITTYFASLIINYLQVGFLFTTKPLEPKFSRINPIEGFKRIFSKKAFVELGKSIIKILLIGYVAYSFIKKRIGILVNLPSMAPIQILKNFSNLSFQFGIRILGVLLVVSALDYFYQWWDYEKNLMMSKEELKEEFKQTEGDPLVKSKIKEKQRKMAFNRMMQEVPKADVIVTNPTHIAVALKYDQELNFAPIVVAKGADIIAENIKKTGKENSIPIVENKPLARAIYETVDVGDIIPEELYETVAEVLAYVYSLKDKF